MAQGNSRKALRSLYREIHPDILLIRLPGTADQVITDHLRHQDEMLGAYIELHKKLDVDLDGLSHDQLDEEIGERTNFLINLACFHAFPIYPRELHLDSSDDVFSRKKTNLIESELKDYVGFLQLDILSLSAYLYYFIETGRKLLSLRSHVVRNFLNRGPNADQISLQEFQKVWEQLYEYLEIYKEGMFDTTATVDKWLVKLWGTEPGQWTTKLRYEVDRAGELLKNIPTDDVEAELSGPADLLKKLENRLSILETLDHLALQEVECGGKTSLYDEDMAVKGIGEAEADLLTAEQADGTNRADTSEKKEPALSKEEKALAVLVANPMWTLAKIAEAAGCKRQSLYKMKKFMAAKAALKQGRDELPRGEKDAKTKAMEAWEPESDHEDDSIDSESGTWGYESED